MAQTYTSQWFRVSNGEVTTHNPQALVPTSKDIRILSADVQWEGVGTTVRRSPSNSDSYGEIGGSWTGPAYPEVPSGGSFVEQQLSASGSTEQYSNEIHDPHETIDVQYSFDINRTYSSYETGNVVAQATGNGKYESISVTVTTVYDDSIPTQDPRVTRDVSGESSAALSDGEQSNWVTLTGLSADSEEFYHDLAGSGEARFRFRFDWERVFPDALAELRIGSRDGSQIHSVALADPADSQLEYNHVRVLVDGQVLAIDVVDPTDSNALEWLRIGTPQGVVCPRVFQTTST